MSTSENLENVNWSVAEGEDDGKPLYIRFRDEFRGRPAAQFPRLIRIVWSYEADEKGLPTLEAIPSLKDFESRLVQAARAIAVLVAAITNNGQREWMFYASGLAAFEACLNSIQEGQELYPIEVTSARDPKWSAYTEDILDSVTE
jgi:hypothetical protein